MIRGFLLAKSRAVLLQEFLRGTLVPSRLFIQVFRKSVESISKDNKFN